MPSVKEPRIGYVLKMYPRFSETFIVNEILAHEAAGTDIRVFSLRLPTDGRFHEALAEVRAPVTYLSSFKPKSDELWTWLRDSVDALPRLTDEIPELLTVDVRDAVHALELARHVIDQGITHLHAHFGSVATTVTRVAARITDVPYSFTAHAKDIFHESVEREDLARKLRDAAAVITVSEHNLRYLRDAYWQDAQRVYRVYNGLDLARFSYQTPQDRPPVIASVSRLVEKKGLSYLLEACALLAERTVPFKCKVVGAGPLESQLRDQAAHLSLDDYVEFLGPLPQSQVRRLIQEAAVFAAPCVVGSDGNRDGLPTALLEAMALGTPCVATDVTGLPEIVRQGRTGLAVPQYDARKLAGALELLLGDRDLRTSLATEARRLIEEEFDIARQSARLREHFAPAPAVQRVHA